MFNLIKKFLAKIDAKKMRNDKLIKGDDIWIYFKNVNRCFKMSISGITSTMFTARFQTWNDLIVSRIIDDYNQYTDNDIKFNKDTCEPIVMNF